MPGIDVTSFRAGVPGPPVASGVDLEIRRLGQMLKRITTEADPTDVRELRQALVDAVKRDGGQQSQIAEYEMDIRYSR
jgi:hypothetical protein